MHRGRGCPGHRAGMSIEKGGRCRFTILKLQNLEYSQSSSNRTSKKLHVFHSSLTTPPPSTLCLSHFLQSNPFKDPNPICIYYFSYFPHQTLNFIFPPSPSPIPAKNQIDRGSVIQGLRKRKRVISRMKSRKGWYEGEDGRWMSRKEPQIPKIKYKKKECWNRSSCRNAP